VATDERPKNTKQVKEERIILLSIMSRDGMDTDPSRNLELSPLKAPKNRSVNNIIIS